VDDLVALGGVAQLYVSEWSELIKGLVHVLLTDLGM